MNLVRLIGGAHLLNTDEIKRISVKNYSVDDFIYLPLKII